VERGRVGDEARGGGTARDGGGEILGTVVLSKRSGAIN
jgi:hypothetical protein